jgi:hypothetical protein
MVGPCPIKNNGQDHLLGVLVPVTLSDAKAAVRVVDPVLRLFLRLAFAVPSKLQLQQEFLLVAHRS